MANLTGLQLRFSGIVDEYLKTEGIQDVVETIQSVGIRRHTAGLLNSIRYLGETSTGVYSIIIGSDTPGEAGYQASFLNRGYGAFDMKPGLMGKTVPLKTTSGTVFRRVGPHSSPDSWIHPGYQATNFVEKAKQKIEEGIVVRIEQYLNEIEPDREY